MIKTVYLAGPYSGDTTGNVKAAIIVAEQVSRLGLHPFVPHLFHYWDQLYPHEYEFWMKQDALWIPKCDALFMYEESPGAWRDFNIALDYHIPTFITLQHLAQAVVDQTS